MAGAANAGEVRARLVLDNSQFREGVRQARGDLDGLRQGSTGASTGMSTLATASAAVGTAVVGMASAAVMSSANFEQSMAKVKAIGGATGEEFERLKSTAKDLGATTSFSATQAADGMALLAAAGFKTNDIIDSMPGLLNLAAAANLDLATSADYLGSMMSGFGIKATDSGHAVDVLVRAMNDANTDLPDLAEAMKYVAPVASSLGVSFEDTAAAIALMSNAGIKGSQAGTTLRATLLSMANPVGQAKEAMDKLGISYKNANGEMKPLPEILDHVKGKMEGMTDAQKTQYAAMLVGTEASSGFLTLLKEGGSTLTNFSNNLKNSAGSAQEMADTMRDTLMGQWDNFTGALETAGIKMGDALLPVAKDLLGVLTNMAQAVGELDPKMVSAGLAAAGTAAGVALLATGLSKAVTAVRTFSIALATNPATAWIAGISVAMGVLAGTFAAAKKETDDYKEISFETYKSLDQQSNSVKTTAESYDNLRSKVNLNNEELLKYQSLQQDLERAPNAQAKAEVQAQLDALVQKSGAHNEEIKKTISLSDELIKQSPSTARSFDDRGNAIATSTDAARQYVEELNKAKEAELEMQKAQAMKNLHHDIDKYQQSVKAVNDLTDEQPKKIDRINEAKSNLAKTEKVLADMKDKGEDTGLQEQVVARAKKGVELAEQELRTNQANIYTKTAEVRLSEQALQKGNQAFEQYNAIKMSQQGINYEKGKEIEAIDSAISKEQQKVSQLNEIKSKKGELTAEEQKQLETSTQTLDKLGQLKGEITTNKQEQEDFNMTLRDGKREAGELNDTAGQPVNKEVKVNTEGAKGELSYIDQLAQQGKTKPLDLNPTLANAKIQEVNAAAEEGRVKPVDLNPTIANAKLFELNAKAEEEKTKPIDANPLSAYNKIEGLNNFATEPKTKPIDANPLSAMNKLGQVNSSATEQKTKPVDANTSSADSKISNLNFEAQKPVTKNVTVWYQSAGDKLNAGAQRHNGGTTQSIRPKFHNGGSPIAQRPNRPKFDEVDVRLLKNEMVLTAGQQENLFNMIRTFNVGAAMSLANAAEAAKSNSRSGGDVNVHVAELHVREEADVEKVAKELDRISKQRSRARGY